MTYFTWLGLLFGAAALLKPFALHLLPWDERAFLARTYTERRPRWVVPVALIGLAWVALTWYLHVALAVPHSWVMALLFSLTAVKGLALLLDYRRFQAWVARMLSRDRGRSVVAIDVAVGALGFAIVVVALVVY